MSGVELGELTNKGRSVALRQTVWLSVFRRYPSRYIWKTLECEPGVDKRHLKRILLRAFWQLHAMKVDDVKGTVWRKREWRSNLGSPQHYMLVRRAVSITRPEGGPVKRKENQGTVLSWRPNVEIHWKEMNDQPCKMPAIFQEAFIFIWWIYMDNVLIQLWGSPWQRWNCHSVLWLNYHMLLSAISVPFFISSRATWLFQQTLTSHVATYTKAI